MKETNAEKIGTAVQKQRDFFLSGATLELNFRKDALRRLLEAVRKNESPIASALQADLGKSEFEAYACETGLLIAELRLHIAKMASWAKPKRAPISLLNFPAKGALWPEPYGSSLIIAPWNYPFLLALMPLIGAISAGCCAILKPSEFAPRSSELIETLLSEVFPPGHVLPISGAADTAKELLQHKFDFIFFTGGPAQGREVMAAAAKELTPVLLELGGKSPCIVGNDADISVAARRIAWGKFLNAGQTCVSPDYLLVQKEIREPFLAEMKKCIGSFWGPNPLGNPEYPRIVNERHYERLSKLLSSGKAFCGGNADRESLRIEPTMLVDVPLESPVMAAEIFGPILPVFTIENLDEAISFVNSRPSPLALYYFGKNKEAKKRIASSVRAGGICFNDTIVQLTEAALPFGGIGESGFGAHHGKASFDAFTHYKPVMSRGCFPDLPIRYPPFSGKLRLLKKFMNWL